MSTDNRLKKDKRRQSEVHGGSGALRDGHGHAVAEYKRNTKWGIERSRFGYFLLVTIYITWKIKLSEM